MNRIREYRLRKNLTQIELSQALNISQATLSAYETGRFEPDIATLLRLADFFDVSIDNIIGRSAEETGEPLHLTPDESQLLAAYRAAPPDIQQFMLNALSPYLNAKKAARA